MGWLRGLLTWAALVPRARFLRRHGSRAGPFCVWAQKSEVSLTLRSPVKALTEGRRRVQLEEEHGTGRPARPPVGSAACHSRQ